MYLAAFAAGFIVFLLVLRIPGDERGTLDRVTPAMFLESLNVFRSDRRLFATATVDLGTYFVFGIFETFFPIYLVENGVDAYLIGIIFAVQVLSIAITKPVFGKIADQRNPRYQIGVGIGLLGFSVSLIPVSSSLLLLLGISLVSGIGISLSTVATTKYVADLAKKEEIGASMGALSSLMDIGHSTGPLVAGLLITISGFVAGFSSCLLLSILIAGYFWVATRPAH